MFMRLTMSQRAAGTEGMGGRGPATAAKLSAMSAATIDRRRAAERKKMQLKGRSLTKPVIAAQEPDPDPHLGGMERRRTRVRRDRPGRARGRRPARRLLPDLDRDR